MTPSDLPGAGDHAFAWRRLPELRDWSGYVAIGLVSIILGVNSYRASTQSITHDEALTYHLFLAEKYDFDKLDRVLTRYDANHHLLHTYLCLLSTKLFGLSELTMRLPSLCGGLIYLVASVRLCRLLHGPGVVFLVAVALLTLNPFVLDYLSIARGYGLALGFFTWSLVEVVRGLESVSSGASPTFPPGLLRKISLLLALTVLSNLTFLLASSALAILLMGLLIAKWPEACEGRSRNEKIALLLRRFVRPGFLLFCVLGIPLLKARAGHFYLGEERASQSIAGLIAASLAHHRTVWPWDTSSAGFLRCIDVLAIWGAIAFGVAIVILTARLASIGRREWASSRRDVEARFRLLIGATFLLTVVMVATLHLALHVKYPSERTGLYLVPLAVLCGMSVVGRLLARRGPWRIVGAGAVVGCLLVVGQFVIQFHTSYYRTWQYDAASRRVFQLIERQHAQNPDRRVRVACSWVFEPSFNFYRVSRRADWMDVVQRTVDLQQYDYYVESPIAPLPGRPTSLVFHDEVSGTVVGVPNVGTTRTSAAESASDLNRAFAFTGATRRRGSRRAEPPAAKRGRLA